MSGDSDSQDLISGAEKALSFDHALRRASELLAHGLTAQAQSWCEQALALRPANVLAQHLLALVLFEAEEHRKASEIFEGLVRQNPDVVPLRLNAGLAAVRCNLHVQALEHFRRAVDLDPGHQRTFGYLALLHLQLAEPEFARAALQEAELEALANQLPEHLDGETAARLTEAIEEQLKALPRYAPAGETAPAPHEGFTEIPLFPEELRALAAAAAPALRPERSALFGLPPSPPSATASDDRILDFDEAEGSSGVHSPGPHGAGASDSQRPGATDPPGTERAGGDESLPPPYLDGGEPGSVPSPPGAESQTDNLLAAVHSPAAAAAPTPWPAVGPAILPRLKNFLASRVVAIPQQGAALPCGPGLVSLQVGVGQVEKALVRQDLMLFHQGNLRWSSAHRMSRGMLRDPFLVGPHHMLNAAGQGAVVLAPPEKQHLALLWLDEEGVFLPERALGACAGKLHWENGRLPGAAAHAPALVHVYGTGFLTLCHSETLVACPVTAEHHPRVNLAHLEGWTKGVVPSGIIRLEEQLVVGFTGEGMVMLTVNGPIHPGDNCGA